MFKCEATARKRISLLLGDLLSSCIENAHIKSNTITDTNYYSIKSRFLYFEKNYSKWSVLLFKCVYKPLFLIELGLDLISKLPVSVKYRVKKDFAKKYLLEFLEIV